MTADARRSMRAMLFDGVASPLRLAEVAVPEPGPGQLLLRVLACGVCRTDLHLLDGEVEIAHPPRILGHQIVARVEPDGPRVGVPWLGWTCGECAYCRSGRENLCPRARFTGRDVDGGFAEYAVADERFCFPIPDGFPDDQAAPLLCAGLIGYRALRILRSPRSLGALRALPEPPRRPRGPPTSPWRRAPERARSAGRRGGHPRGWRISKAKSRDNIDAVVAMAMAVEAAENKPAPVGSCF
jgi:hypothetical protein